MDQTPDSSFRKYFDWPTHKDPKGTIKIETVIVKTSLSEEIPRGYVRPTKKKKRMAVKTPSKVTDEDFLLLEAFLWEISVRGTAITREQVASPSQDQVVKFFLFQINLFLFFFSHYQHMVLSIWNCQNWEVEPVKRSRLSFLRSPKFRTLFLSWGL